jgi:hypothetical protein
MTGLGRSVPSTCIAAFALRTAHISVQLKLMLHATPVAEAGNGRLRKLGSTEPLEFARKLESPPKIMSNFVDDYERVLFLTGFLPEIRANCAKIIMEKTFKNAVLLSKFLSRHVSILVKVAIQVKPFISL